VARQSPDRHPDLEAAQTRSTIEPAVLSLERRAVGRLVPGAREPSSQMAFHVADTVDT